MRKNFLLPLLTLLTLALLGGCSADAPKPQAESTTASDSELGRYTCVSVQADGMDIGAEGQWIQLDPHGHALLFLMDSPDEGKWTRSGNKLTLIQGGETVGRGTLESGRLVLDLMGTQCVFTKDGTSVPAVETAPQDTGRDEDDQPPEGCAYLSCYGDLYRVTYPTDTFQPSTDGLTDLTDPEAGTQVWLSRLDSRDAVEQWLTGLAEKADSPDVLSWEDLSLPVGDWTAQGALYEEEKGWSATLVVDFGKDKGTKTYPMYAAVFSFAGEDRETAWNDTLQALTESLELLT